MFATTQTVPASRFAGLRAELAHIRQDRAMAARFAPETTRGWLADLDAEQRDVWEHLHEAATFPDTRYEQHQHVIGGAV